MNEDSKAIEGTSAYGELAHLIPVVADSHKERRATSATLATIHSVNEFGRELLKNIRAPIRKTSRIECYTEITFPTKKSIKTSHRPDGLIVIRTGKKIWCALIEAKTKREQLSEAQVTTYVDIARANNIDAVITISNQFAPRPTHHPVSVNKQKLRKVDLFHWSWTYLMAEAVLHIKHRRVEDRDQAYILGELIRYLDHPSSGIMEFDAFPKAWPDICTRARERTMLTRSTKGVDDVVHAWQALTRYIALKFSTRIGRTVTVTLPSKHDKDPDQRFQHDLRLLCDEYRMEEHFSIPDAAAKVTLEADLKTRTLRCSMNLGAPRDRKQPQSCVTWIVNQLKKVEDPGSILIFARWPGRMQDTSAPLSVLREDRDALLTGTNGKMPHSFDVALSWDLAGNFSKVKKFVEAGTEIIPAFYEAAGQHLRLWVPKPPKLEKPQAKPDKKETNEKSSTEPQDSNDSAPVPWVAYIQPSTYLRR